MVLTYALTEHVHPFSLKGSSANKGNTCHRRPAETEATTKGMGENLWAEKPAAVSLSVPHQGVNTASSPCQEPKSQVG